MIINKEVYHDDDKSIGYIDAVYESSNILKSTYFPKSNVLYLAFKHGYTYKYDNLDNDTYNEFELAESQGKYLNQKIKSNKDIVATKSFELTKSEINDAKEILKEWEDKKKK